MTCKNFGLLIIFCLAIALVGCGGGGGSSNPAGASTDPAVDTTLSTDYPLVSSAYTSMQTSLEEDATKTTTQRVDSFMLNIASDFVNYAGAPASESMRTTTLSRLDRYTINSYKFIPTAHEVVDANTVKVTTYMSIDLVRKPGAEGAIAMGTVVTNTPYPVITWKNYSGTWRIYRGLPYLSSENSNVSF
ncbi:MAG: hypothetical protein EOM80_12880 [Erysipelotrichia bacterium]|nr:hypothetical protein [Erysipelotrichia bacterium]